MVSTPRHIRPSPVTTSFHWVWSIIRLDIEGFVKLAMNTCLPDSEPVKTSLPGLEKRDPTLVLHCIPELWDWWTSVQLEGLKLWRNLRDPGNLQEQITSKTYGPLSEQIIMHMADNRSRHHSTARRRHDFPRTCRWNTSEKVRHHRQGILCVTNVTAGAHALAITLVKKVVFRAMMAFTTTYWNGLPRGLT